MNKTIHLALRILSLQNHCMNHIALTAVIMDKNDCVRHYKEPYDVIEQNESELTQIDFKIYNK